MGASLARLTVADDPGPPAHAHLAAGDDLAASARDALAHLTAVHHRAAQFGTAASDRIEQLEAHIVALERVVRESDRATQMLAKTHKLELKAAQEREAAAVAGAMAVASRAAATAAAAAAAAATAVVAAADQEHAEETGSVALKLSLMRAQMHVRDGGGEGGSEEVPVVRLTLAPEGAVEEQPDVGRAAYLCHRVSSKGQGQAGDASMALLRL